MSTKLAPLRSHLADLRRRRLARHLAAGVAAWALVMCGVLVADFVIDWLVEPAVVPRVVMLACCAIAAVWAAVRCVLPALSRRETDLDLALVVERNQGIDGDLVAALQFESPEAESWGSPHLTEAVVDRVSGFGNELDVSSGLPSDRTGRIFAGLAVSMALIAAVATQYPRHALAFVDRFFLGSQHYPTRTKITRIVVNGAPAYPATIAVGAIHSPFGQPVRFEIEYDGPALEEGTVRLTSSAARTTTSIVLSPVATESAAEDGTQGLAGELPRLHESVSFQVYAGDAWTDPISIEVVPLPIVAVELSAAPPQYAAGSRPPAERAGALRITAIEGSRVDVRVRCDNKSLESVVVAIGEKEWPCQRDDDNGRQWRLPVDSTPFERLSEPLNFDVRAVDVDGLSPAELISGHIGVAPDRPPRALIGAVAGKVLPAARPVLSYGAADDYGLSALVLRLQVTHSGGEVRSSELPVWKISEGEAPQTALRGRYNLDLGPLGLSVGDKVRVTLEARDFRGSQSGTTAESEPVTLQVTDEKGVLAELNESDEKSFRILDELIQRQLGMGETR